MTQLSPDDCDGGEELLKYFLTEAFFLLGLIWKHRTDG